jgi:glutathione S-transferase
VSCASVKGHERFWVANDASFVLSVQVASAMVPTFQLTDLDERAAARKALMQPGGKLHDRYSVIDKLLGVSSSTFYLGDDIGLADATVFVLIGQVSGGCAVW